MVIVLAIARSAGATSTDPYFTTTSGYSLGACTISTDSKCVSSPNYPSPYPNYQAGSCAFSRVSGSTTYVSACAFSTEQSYDTLSFGGSAYSGESSSSSNFLSPGTPVYQSRNSMVECRWSSDHTMASTGWKICAYSTYSAASNMNYCNADTNAPTPPPSSNMTVIHGACTLQGDCVSSPNHPSSYSSGDTCNISVNNAGYLTSTAFNTESSYDQVAIRRRGGTYSGSSGGALTISNVYVPRSSMIDWSTDASITSSGWKICYSSTSGGTSSGSSSSVQVVASLSFYDSHLIDSTQTGLKLNFQTTIQNWYSSLALSFAVTGVQSYDRRSGWTTYTMTGSSSANPTSFAAISTSGLSSSIASQARGVCNSASYSCSFASVNSVTASSGSGDDCCDVHGSSDCTFYTGSCGAFSQESSCWTSSICVADSEDKCCDVNGGAVAGVVIGCFVCLVGGILLCCFLCPSCPGAKCCKNKHDDDGVIVQQPVPITSMGAQQAQAAPVFQPQPQAVVAQYPAKPGHQCGLDAPPPYVPSYAAPADPHSSGANSYQPSYEPTTVQAAGGGVTVRTWNCQSCNHSNVTSGAFCANCGQRNSVVPSI